MFLRNAWYAAADVDELGAEPLARTILGEPVVLYRGASGQIVAMSDRCPHRLSPLSLGTVMGDDLRCAYHGARFGPDGACVEVPGQPTAPPRLRVQTYPIVERFGYAMIWMGEPERADASLMPGLFECLERPGWDHMRTAFMSLPTYWEHINDNLFDTTHAAFVHPETLGMDEFPRILREKLASGKVTDTFEGEEGAQYEIRDHGMAFQIRCRAFRPSPGFDVLLGRRYGRHHYCEGGELADFDMNVFWEPPAYFTFNPLTRPAGGTPAEGIAFTNFNFITPETESTTHYFFGVAQCWAPEDRGLTKAAFEIVDFAFNQDKVILEGQQRRSGTGDVFENNRPMSFGGDSLGLQGRKILRALLAEESERADAPA